MLVEAGQKAHYSGFGVQDVGYANTGRAGSLYLAGSMRVDVCGELVAELDPVICNEDQAGTIGGEVVAA